MEKRDHLEVSSCWVEAVTADDEREDVGGGLNSCSFRRFLMSTDGVGTQSFAVLTLVIDRSMSKSGLSELR